MKKIFFWKLHMNMQSDFSWTLWIDKISTYNKLKYTSNRVLWAFFFFSKLVLKGGSSLGEIVQVWLLFIQVWVFSSQVWDKLKKKNRISPTMEWFKFLWGHYWHKMEKNKLFECGILVCESLGGSQFPNTYNLWQYKATTCSFR